MSCSSLIAALRRQGGAQGLRGAVAGAGQQIGGDELLELCLAGAVLGLAVVQLVQGGAELPLARPVLGQPVLILLQAVLILGIPVLIFLQAVLVLRFSVVVLVPAVVQLRPAVEKLLLAVLELDQSLGQLLLAVGELLLRLRHLFMELPDAVAVLRPAVVQLRTAVLELRPGVGELPLRLGGGVGERLLRLRHLLLRLADDLRAAQVRPLPGKVLQTVCQTVDVLCVGVVIAEKVRGPLRLDVKIRVCLHIEGVQRQQHEGGHLAGAQGGGAPVRADVQRGVGGAHNGEAGGPQSIRVVSRAGVQLDGVSHAKTGLLQQQRLRQALVRRLGQAPLHQPGGVEPRVLREGEDLHDILVFGQRDHGVHGIGPLHRRHAGLLRQGGGIRLREPQRGEDVEVHQLLLVKIQVRGLLHVRGRGPQPRQEAHRQSGEDQQRDEAAEGVPDLPQGVGQDAIFPKLHRPFPRKS